MLRRIENDEPSAAARRLENAEPSHPIVPPAADGDVETNNLPHDHPSWVRDAIAISSRARELVAKLKPAIVAVMSFWDHRLRSIVVAGRHVRIDASGSYRTD